MESLTQTLIFPLTNRSVRQVFDYETENTIYRLMYDSGARIPVWCSNEEFFVKTFPKAIKSPLIANVSGFGAGAESASVYCLPEFILDDGKHKIVIKNLLVVILFKPQIGCDFIISETMLSKTNTYTYRIGKKELHIVSEKECYYCTAKKSNGELMDISIWSQESILIENKA